MNINIRLLSYAPPPPKKITGVDYNQVAADCRRFADLHEDFVQPDVDFIVDGRPLIAKWQWV